MPVVPPGSCSSNLVFFWEKWVQLHFPCQMVEQQELLKTCNERLNFLFNEFSVYNSVFLGCWSRCSHYTTGVLHKTWLAKSCILFLSWKMLFPCQHHSWEVWPGQGKASSMVSNKFLWIPIMLWQQELAPGICFFSAWGGKSHQSWKVAPWMTCPSLGFLQAGTVHECAEAVALCWGGHSGWSLWLRVCHPRDLLFETGQNCVYSIFSTPQNVTFLPLILLPYLTAALLCCCSGSVFPRIQPGLQKPASWHGHSHTSGKCYSPLPLEPCNIDVSLVNSQIKFNFFLLLK